MKIKEELEMKYAGLLKRQSESKYGRARMDFIDKWTTSMETALSNGERLSQCAPVLGEIALEQTPDMREASIAWCAGTIQEFWVYGKEFYNWASAKYGE